MIQPHYPLKQVAPKGPSELDNDAPPLAQIRQLIREHYIQGEEATLHQLLDTISIDSELRDTIEAQACQWVTELRQQNKPTMMESFLSEYGLSTPEGVGLMCLAEALLRVPDAITIDELIRDKVESSNWAAHLGQSSSPLVNASTWALLITGRVLDESSTPAQSLSSLIKRVGEPFVRTAVAQAMKQLGNQFVLGQDIEQAVSRARHLEASQYTYSYDMLGEAAHTYRDSQRYAEAYSHAIDHISTQTGSDPRNKPGISIKLSALHPRYEYKNRERVVKELLPTVTALAEQAAAANIGFNIDAEESDRLDLSLDIFEALLRAPSLANWQGLGFVVQAYNRRALFVVQWLVAAARQYNRHVMVRLVKGAYWDTEIKQAQELGLENFPVFTRKVSTDISYLACAERLIQNKDCVYPQFATHNAHSVSAIVAMAGSDTSGFEFQRLHGMGEALHEHVRKECGTRCRIYAPVGAHQDLLAYLVRRLLENGANSSFVNQIIDKNLAPSDIGCCPIKQLQNTQPWASPMIKSPSTLFFPERYNSKGFRTNEPASVNALLEQRAKYRHKQWLAIPVINNQPLATADSPIVSPQDSSDVVGYVFNASAKQVNLAIQQASVYQNVWQTTSVEVRAKALHSAALAYEENTPELCALLCREAGKTLDDAIAEIREAVDFLRYYAQQSLEVIKQEPVSTANNSPHGILACISPWNFPLAIFTGQIAGALVSGNVVIAKPAEQTPLVAAFGVTLLHEAGIPTGALQFLPGPGDSIGTLLTEHPQLDGVCFTGSTSTARSIERSLCERSVSDVASGCTPNPLLMAETGGLNAMIVDSTALTEQVVRDTIISAFQSAGQRCSALRMLYVQTEAKERVMAMLKGAMDTLNVGEPWNLATDVGPVIDRPAYDSINAYIARQKIAGNLVHQARLHTAQVSKQAQYIPPTLLEVSGIEAIEKEVFGPVLHIASFDSQDLDQVIKNINARGFGLTFGIHSRIDDRVQHIIDRVAVGNIYVNRNQIGAVVGSQPFGGEGLSGTGPKAGGPWYLHRLARIPYTKQAKTSHNDKPNAVLPGPTGESNRWHSVARSPILVIGHDDKKQQDAAEHLNRWGCRTHTLIVSDIQNHLAKLVQEYQIKAVAVIDATPSTVLAIRKVLASTDGAILPIIEDVHDLSYILQERHICIDTTAAGGNATLLNETAFI